MVTSQVSNTAPTVQSTQRKRGSFDTCDFSLPFEVAKTTEPERLVFGWLSVAETADGEAIIDKQGDVIPVEELERAAYEFVLDFRNADTMHNEQVIGKLVESVVFTRDKQKAMGVSSPLPIGWWVGFRVEPDVFKRVQAGELKAFSIGGSAVRGQLDG